MPEIVIGNNQNRVKDSYAPAAIIDLTLRANGEEEVMVMDSLGLFSSAGFESPTVAPVLAIGSASTFTPSTWVAYRYVYAATERYPYVENAISAGGDISPRSNPSPSASIQINAFGNGSTITVTYSLRVDISRIWIYRTAEYATSAEAITAADAGLCNFVASVANNAIPGTTTYSDTTPIISGNEFIEVDNFEAPQFALALYDPPYFYGYGNQEFYAPISVTAAGLITLTSPSDKWLDGRDGQTVTMEGITSGGFDGYGGYYFKWLTATTAQLCLDIALTLNGPVSAYGSTYVRIKGESTTLYRSKPNNPFSWGELENIGDISVPQLYALKVGGGQGTAMAIVPILNLLKLDTEAPNKTYVFNLNGKGTPTFEASKREISNDFSTSNHWSQFTTKGADGNSYLWFFDYKYKSICQADGAVNTSVSSPLFDTLRNLSTDEDDRKFGHGVYDPGLELSCVWLTTEGSSIRNNLLIVYHHPTDQWSMVEQRDVTCSLSFLDRLSNEQITLIGTDTGYIGQAFAKDYYWDWISPADILAPNNPQIFTLQSATSTDLMNELSPIASSVVGVWCYVEFVDKSPTISPYQTQAKGRIVGSVRISVVDPGGFALVRLTFDKFITSEGVEVSNMYGLMPASDLTLPSLLECSWMLYTGAILCNACKLFPSPDPVQAIKITDIHAVADFYSYLGAGNSDAFRALVAPEYQNIWNQENDPNVEQTLTLFAQNSRYKNTLTATGYSDQVASNIWISRNAFKLDKWNTFRLSLEHIGYGPMRLYNYRVTFNV